MTQNKYVIIRKKLFGKEIEFTLKNIDEEFGKDIIENVYIEALRLQKIFNLYDENSELSKLNNKRKLKVSNEFLEVLTLALEYSKITNGKYDISKGKLFLARKNKKIGIIIKGIDKEPILNCSWKDIIIEGNLVILNHKDVIIDLGSIAKGYIVDKLTEMLKEEGIEIGIVNGRGDINVFGEEQIIGIANPRSKDSSTDSIIKKIKIKDLSVATSGDYMQYNESYDKSHIINQNELISVTVVADTLTKADLFATILMVLDKKDRDSLLNIQKHNKVMMIDDQMNIYYFNDFEKLIVGDENEI